MSVQTIERRTCEVCGVRFARRDGEAASRFYRRATCGRTLCVDARKRAAHAQGLKSRDGYASAP